MEREIEFFGSPLVVQQELNDELGATVWDSALVLIKYFENVEEFPLTYFKNKRVIELGSGTGAVGLAVARLGGTVTLTDRGPLVPLLHKNIQLNRLESRTGAKELTWGENLSAFQGPFDVILMSDVVAKTYMDSYPALIETLRAFSTPDSRILLAYELRAREDRVFFEMLSADFTYRKVSDDKLDEMYRAEDIGIFEISRKGPKTEPAEQLPKAERRTPWHRKRCAFSCVLNSAPSSHKSSTMTSPQIDPVPSDQDSEWNKVDSLNLLAMIRKCCNWEAVSEGMKGRTAEECESYYVSFLNLQYNKLERGIDPFSLDDPVRRRKPLPANATASGSAADTNSDSSKKRVRRKATQIKRLFQCPVEVCGKSYGTEGALKMHLKLKHPDVDYDPMNPPVNIKEVLKQAKGFEADFNSVNDYDVDETESSEEARPSRSSPVASPVPNYINNGPDSQNGNVIVNPFAQYGPNQRLSFYGMNPHMHGAMHPFAMQANGMPHPQHIPMLTSNGVMMQQHMMNGHSPLPKGSGEGAARPKRPAGAMEGGAPAAVSYSVKKAKGAEPADDDEAMASLLKLKAF